MERTGRAYEVGSCPGSGDRHKGRSQSSQSRPNQRLHQSRRIRVHQPLATVVAPAR